MDNKEGAQAPLLNNRRIARNTLMLYIRMFCTMLVSLYTSRIVLQTLGEVDYGVYNVVGGVVMMFSFLNGAMSAGTQRYLNYEMGRGDRKRLNEIFSASLTIHIIIAAAVFVLAESVGLWFMNTQLQIPPERMEAANWVYQFSILTLMVTITQIPYSASIIANEKMNIYAVISIIEVALKLLLVLLLVNIAHDKLSLYAILMFVSSTIVALLFRLYCKRQFAECKYRYRYDKALWLELGGYAGWSLWGDIAAVSFNQGINILLNIFFGPVVNAARAISYQINGVIVQFVANFQLAMNPQIVKSYASGDIEKMMRLVYRGSKFSFLLLFFVTAPVLLNVEYLLSFWLGEYPENTVLFCKWVLFNALLVSPSGTLMVGMQATGRIRLYQSIVGGILLLNVPISYLFLKLGYPPVVAFQVMVGCTVVAFFARLFIIRRHLPLRIMDFMLKVMLRPVLLTALLWWMLWQGYATATNLWSFVLNSSIVVAVTGLLIFIVGFNREERGWLIYKVRGLFDTLLRKK